MSCNKKITEVAQRLRKPNAQQSRSLSLKSDKYVIKDAVK